MPSNEKELYMLRKPASFAALMCCMFFTTIVATGVTTTAAAADLKVEIQGLKNITGFVEVALYNHEEDFPMAPFTKKRVAASADALAAIFQNLPVGDYAVLAFHDENSNGTLDHNLLRMPSEPLGFSRDARGRMGPPSFKDAKFSVSQTNQTVVVSLH